MGTIKGLGKIYQQADVDNYGGFGFAKVILVYQMFDIPLDRILTDHSKEYTTHWKNGKHDYEIFLNSQGIRHTKTKPRCLKSKGIVERFNRTLSEEFYQIAMIKKVYISLAKLQYDLDRFIGYYNFKRTN